MSVKIDVVTRIVWTTVVEAEGKHTAKLPVSQTEAASAGTQ